MNPPLHAAVALGACTVAILAAPMAAPAGARTPETTVAACATVVSGLSAPMAAVARAEAGRLHLYGYQMIVRTEPAGADGWKTVERLAACRADLVAVLVGRGDGAKLVLAGPLEARSSFSPGAASVASERFEARLKSEGADLAFATTLAEAAEEFVREDPYPSRADRRGTLTGVECSAAPQPARAQR